MNAMSTSTPPIQITVTPETPGMDLNLFNASLGQDYTPTSGPGTQVDYGSQLMASAMVAPTSQTGFLQSVSFPRNAPGIHSVRTRSPPAPSRLMTMETPSIQRS